jgi:hypothetical protein
MHDGDKSFRHDKRRNGAHKERNRKRRVFEKGMGMEGQIRKPYFKPIKKVGFFL